MGTMQLFQRTKATVGNVKFSKVLKFTSGGAKSATQRSVEQLGMVQTPTVQVRTVQAPDGGSPDPYVENQWGDRSPAVTMTGVQCFPGDVLYAVIDGRRRALDSFTSGDSEMIVTVLPEETNSRTIAGIAASLNINRKPNPLQEARHLQNMVGSGMLAEQIADTLGIPLQTIKKRLRLLRLPDDITEALEAGKIAPGVAQRIANLSEPQVQKLQTILKEKGKLQGKDVRRVQEKAKVEQAKALGEQVAIGFQMPDVEAPTSGDVLEAAIQEDPWAVLEAVATELMLSGTSYTQIRQRLSELNRQV